MSANGETPFLERKNGLSKTAIWWTTLYQWHCSWKLYELKGAVLVQNKWWFKILLWKVIINFLIFPYYKPQIESEGCYSRGSLNQLGSLRWRFGLQNSRPRCLVLPSPRSWHGELFEFFSYYQGSQWMSEQFSTPSNFFMIKLTFESDRARQAESKKIINLSSEVPLEFSGNSRSPKNGCFCFKLVSNPFFGLWGFPENSRCTLEGEFINVFDLASRALSDPRVSLVTRDLLVVENFSHSNKLKFCRDHG